MEDALAPHRPYSAALYLETARQMVANGATVSELAQHFGVPVASVELWAACHEEFAAALRVGRALADDRVERSWYRRCVGFSFESEKVLVVDKVVVHEPIREYLPPDAAACERWLRNRRPAQWNERHELRVNGTVTHQISRLNQREIDALPVDEVQAGYAEALAAAGEVLSLPTADGVGDGAVPT